VRDRERIPCARALEPGPVATQSTVRQPPSSWQQTRSTLENQRFIIDQCLTLKLPAIHTYISEARSGALLTYGVHTANYGRLRITSISPPCGNLSLMSAGSVVPLLA